MKPFPIFVGYDPREPVAYHVFCHSIMRHSSIPIAITPVIQPMLRGRSLYWRERETASTAFSFSRFLVPCLSGYRGLALFADCDMVMRADIAELLALADDARIMAGDGPAVMVAKHDYVPKTATKMDGQVQTVYPRKNWSSFMLMECSRLQMLTPNFVNSATGADLHRFTYLADEQIGELPLGWNWLVGEYEPNDAAKNLHYTLGGPWFAGWEECDHAADWYAERDYMFGTSRIAGTLATAA